MNDILTALQQGIAPAIVVTIYLIITKIIDSKRDKAQVKLSSELVKSVGIISDYINDITKTIIERDKEKCKIAIKDAMQSSGMRLVNFVSSTIVNNHINTNKENILANIKNIISAEYYTIYSTLKLYRINGTDVCDGLNKEWMCIIEKDMIEIIYNNDLSKEDKILSFSNKINIRLQSYITLIINTIVK